MNMRQIGLKLALDVLDIPVATENYGKIRDVCYLSERYGVYFSSARVEFDPITKTTYSPKSYDNGPVPSRNLHNDIEEMLMELRYGFDQSSGWKLDGTSTKKLKKLKKDIKKICLKKLLTA